MQNNNNNDFFYIQFSSFSLFPSLSQACVCQL